MEKVRNVKMSRKIAVFCVFALLSVCFLSACNKNKGSGSANGLTEVTISHYKTGANVGAKFFLPQVERFNTKYAGKFKLTIEEVPNDMYVEKIKQLGQQNKLPVLIEGGDQTWLEEVVIPGGLFVDLQPMMNANPDLASRFEPAALAYNTRGGKLFSLVVPVLRPMTVFYNSSLYKPSKSFAQMTWDDVIAEFGNNKIALMTGENAWTTMLLFSSLIALEKGGAQLLRDGVVTKITNFNQPVIITATAKLQKILQNNASANAIGAAYADAANSFMSKRAAIIPNGSWMVSEFSPDKSANWSNGFDGATVHGDVLPGNVGLANVTGYGWWIPATASKAEQELALAFIEFMNTPEELEYYMLAEGGTAPRVAASEEFLQKRAADKLMDEYVGAVNADTIIAPAIGDAMPASVANNEFPRLLPLLVNGTLSPEAFCQELTTRAAESAL